MYSLLLYEFIERIYTFFIKTIYLQGTQNYNPRKSINYYNVAYKTGSLKSLVGLDLLGATMGTTGIGEAHYFKLYVSSYSNVVFYICKFVAEFRKYLE